MRGVEQLLEALRGADAIVEIAPRADAVILFPFLDEHHRPALGALVPKVLGTLPLGQERDAAADSAQPTHRSILASAGMWERPAAMSMIAGAGSGGAGDRPADDKDRCTIVERLGGRDDALLVGHVGARGTDARNDEKTVRPSAHGPLPTSAPEQTIPSTPESRATQASRATWSAGERSIPRSLRSAWSRLVSSVTATTLVFGGAARLAANSISWPPRGVDGEDGGLERRQRATALATVLGMSWNLRSRKTGKPSSGDLPHALGTVRRRRIRGRASRRRHGRAQRWRSSTARVDVRRVDRDEDRVHSGCLRLAARRFGRKDGDAVALHRLDPAAVRPDPRAHVSHVGRKPIRNAISSRMGSLISAWMSLQRFSVTSDQLRLANNTTITAIRTQKRVFKNCMVGAFRRHVR